MWHAKVCAQQVNGRGLFLLNNYTLNIITFLCIGRIEQDLQPTGPLCCWLWNAAGYISYSCMCFLTKYCALYFQAKMSAVEKKCDVLMKGQEKIARMFSEAHNGPADVLSNHKNNPETTSNSSNLKVESRAVVTKWMKSNLLASPMGIFTTSNRNVTLGVPPFVGEIINDTRRPLVLSDGQSTQQIIFLASTNLNTAKCVTLATASQYTANVLARPYARDFQGMSSHFESIFLCVTTYPDEDSYNAAMVANECDTRSITEEQMKKILHQVLIWYVPIYFLSCHI